MAGHLWKLDSASGPRIARLFHGLLGLVFIAAFASLGVQIQLLIGSQGLLPIAPFIDSIAQEESIAWWNFPTVFWLSASDAILNAGILLGIGLSAVAALGYATRIGFAALVVLYLSYATACRDFTSFQWDNLLLECGLLAVLLPRDRPAAWIHFLFRVLLFKLYWESGLAKWNSPLLDWRDGSAMTFYYETAPIPTALAWWAHNLPAGWHHFESRATLVLEFVLPLFAFGPKPARRIAFAALTGFQLLNAATANYGFFCFLSLALHVFLLDEQDIARGYRAALPPPPNRPRGLRIAAGIGATAFAMTYLGLSAIEGARLIHDRGFGPEIESFRRLYVPFRWVNSYHLFASVTRERIEPAFEVRTEEGWRELAFRYKPGPENRPPPFVAPHQPRVDFQLWFYGLNDRRGAPQYVANLMARLCSDPDRVAALFADPPPQAPEAVRLGFARYRFTSVAEREKTGNYWRRESVRRLRPLECRP